METVTGTQQELFDIIEEANLFPETAKKFTDLAKIGQLVEKLEDYCGYWYNKGKKDGVDDYKAMDERNAKIDHKEAYLID